VTTELEATLIRKGWDEEDIAGALQGLKRGEALKSKWAKRFDKVIYWGGLLFTIVISMVVGVAIVPFLLIMEGTWLFAFISLLGVSFGGMLGYLLNSIEKIQQERAIYASLFVPFLALMNIYIITRLSNLLAISMGQPPHNPFLISAMYVWMFCLPYFGHKLFTRTLTKQAIPA
jgi:hypothetical protein|tara:strand:+ start:1857 stop:2378 length:522 start_codon:yes stop_codon:yes gene_type:complete